MIERYLSWVERLKQSSQSYDEAMSLAVGGSFDAIGRIEFDILRYYGLQPDHSVADVGCGSGRLAKPLSGFLRGPYLGTDVVPELVTYAEKLVSRNDWRFVAVTETIIPASAAEFDVVCLFSVLTHLLHEDCYSYLQEATRVTKENGRIIFSFLEFSVANHWSIFEDTIRYKNEGRPLNVFINRHDVSIWADHLGLKMVDIHDADLPYTNSAFGAPDVAPLGQSVCVLTRA